MTGLALLIVVGQAAFPLDPAMIAPGPIELERAVARATMLVQRSETIGRALSRVHNFWGERLARRTLTTPCESSEALGHVALARVLGTAHGHAVQSARAQLHRLDRLIDSPTVVPVLDLRRRRVIDNVIARAKSELQRWRELSAWQRRYVERAVASCAKKVALIAGPGIETRARCPTGECPSAVAIIGIGGGRVCPMDQIADGHVIIAPEGVACYSDQGCECTKEHVTPGTVLGPKGTK